MTPLTLPELDAADTLRDILAEKDAALLAVLPILERGNASYRAMQCSRKNATDCPTLWPLVKLVREAIGGEVGK